MKRLSSLISINTLLGEVVYRFNNHPNITFIFPKKDAKIYADYSVLKLVIYELIAQQLRNAAIEILLDVNKNNGKIDFKVAANKSFELDNPPAKLWSIVQNNSASIIQNDPLHAVKKMVESLGGTLLLSINSKQTLAYSFSLPIEFEENTSTNSIAVTIESEDDLSQAA
jgi:hypothetical protein